MYRERVFHCAAVILQKFARDILYWYAVMRIVRRHKRLLLEWRSAKKIQRFGKWTIFMTRYYAAVEARCVQIRYEKRIALYTVAANKIGFFWRRYVQKLTLKDRFQMRLRAIKEKERLVEERRIAEVEKYKAIKDKLRAG